MKKSFKFVVSFLILNLLLTASVFAEGFHVCVASYQKLSNAQEMVSKLERQSISAIISESQVKNKSYYRVLLSKEFKKIEDARKYRDEVKNYSFVKALNLKDFWVCKSEKIISNKAVVPTPAPAPKVTPKPAPKPAPAPKPVEKKVEPKVEEPKIEPIPEPPVKNIEPEVLPEPSPEPEPEPLPEPTPEVEAESLPPVVEEVKPSEPILLEKKEAVLSEETPFSVAVRSYKYEQFAENDKNRLKELGFNSYLVNTFDDTTFFAFNIHAGVFATRSEAEELQKQFTDAGIEDTLVSDFNDLKEKIKKYDEIITNERVSFDTGLGEIPSSLPDSVANLIREIPVNKNFLLEEISILDLDNYFLSDEKPEGLMEILDAINAEETVHAAALAKYHDELYRKDVKIFITEADKFSFDMEKSSPIEHLQLGSSSGIFECDLYEDAAKFILCGTNFSSKLFIKIETADFSKEEYVDFLNNSFNDSTLAIYPQLRRTLFVLPDVNPEVQRDFISFNLSRVQDSYAQERGNKDWALLIVGHYLAKTFIHEKSALLSLGFYDLDYDFNAKTVHSVFTADKNNVNISGDNQPVRLRDEVDGWYLKNSSQKEVSFSTKSYVIALDTATASSIEKDDLVVAANDLKVWSGEVPSMPNIIDAK